MNADRKHPFDVLLEIDRRSAGRYQPGLDMVQVAERGGRLALRLGSWRLMFDMADVAEIAPLPRITRVPGVKPWFLGIANLRGAVISLVDLQQFLTGTPTRIHPKSRVLMLRSGEWDYGVLMDEVIGMRSFGEEFAVDPQGLVEPGLLPYLEHVYRADDRLWLGFNSTKLLHEEQFLAAEA